MPDTKKPYEIDTSAIQKAGQPNPLRDILRGLVADTRGLLEARQMQRSAADTKQKTIADEAHRQRLANIQERRLQLTKSGHDLNTDEFEEKKRTQTEIENLEKEKLTALKGLKETWAKGHSEFYDLERELREAKRARGDTPDEIADMEIEKLQSRLQKVGTWLERNAEAAEFPAFTRYNDYLNTDEEARTAAEDTDAKAKQSERTLASISDPEIFTDEAQRTLLQKLHAANPDMPLKELIELEKTARESGEDDDTETIRNDKMTIWNAHKAEIMKQHGEGVWQSVASEIKYSDDPNTVDTNQYLEKKPPKTAKKEDNPHILAGNHAQEASIALGESEAIAEEKRREAIKRSVKDEIGEEAATQLERVLDKAKNIQDPELRKYIESSGIKTSSSRKVMSNLAILIDQALRGETDEAMENLGDIWAEDASKTDKTSKSRMQDAIIFQNMRDKLTELKTVYGVETGRMTQAYTDAMSSGNFTAAAKAFGFETLGQGLTKEQIEAVARTEVYMKREFATFLNRISGTAASDTERQNLVAINPNLFMMEELNIGTIDGNIEYLRDREFALFRDNSDPEFAAKVMASKGWDDIKLSTDANKDEPEQRMSRLTALAKAAIAENMTEEEYLKRVKPVFADIDEKEIRRIYQEATKPPEE